MQHLVSFNDCKMIHSEVPFQDVEFRIGCFNFTISITKLQYNICMRYELRPFRLFADNRSTMPQLITQVLMWSRMYCCATQQILHWEAMRPPYQPQFLSLYSQSSSNLLNNNNAFHDHYFVPSCSTMYFLDHPSVHESHLPSSMDDRPRRWVCY